MTIRLSKKKRYKTPSLKDFAQHLPAAKMQGCSRNDDVIKFEQFLSLAWRGGAVVGAPAEHELSSATARENSQPWLHSWKKDADSFMNGRMDDQSATKTNQMSLETVKRVANDGKYLVFTQIPFKAVLISS